MRTVMWLLPLTLVLCCGTSKYDAEKEGGLRLEYGLAETPTAGDPSSDKLLGEAAQVIFKRLQELGEPKYGVSRRGTSILVDLPGFDDPKMLEREKQIIGMTGRLEFRIVDEIGSEQFFMGVSEKLPQYGPIKVLWEQVVVGERVAKSYYLEAKDDLRSGRSGRDILKESLKMIEIPQDRVIGYEKYREVDEAGNPSSGVMWRTYYLEHTAALTGAYLENAAVFNDEKTGRPYVSLDFNQAGGKLFEELTARNVKRRLAIQVDDQVQSAPTIQERIPGGRCRVTLGAYESADRLRREAWNLVVVLRAGALPAPIRLLKEELIKPH